MNSIDEYLQRASTPELLDYIRDILELDVVHDILDELEARLLESASEGKT